MAYVAIADRDVHGHDPETYIQERLAAVEEKKPSLKLQALRDGRVIAIAHRPMANGGWVAKSLRDRKSVV